MHSNSDNSISSLSYLLAYDVVTQTVFVRKYYFIYCLCLSLFLAPLILQNLLLLSWLFLFPMGFSHFLFACPYLHLVWGIISIYLNLCAFGRGSRWRFLRHLDSTMTTTGSLNHISLTRIDFRFEKCVFWMRLGTKTCNLMSHHVDWLRLTSRNLLFSIFIEIKWFAHGGMLLCLWMMLPSVRTMRMHHHIWIVRCLNL